MIIMFPWVELSRDVLYSQQAAVFTVASQQYKHPLFQKMVIFREDPQKNETTESIIRGILSLASDAILLEEYKVEQISKVFPMVKEFKSTKSTYYEFSQKNMISSLRLIDNDGYNQLMNCIMQMRKVSYSPAVYTVEEHERYNTFSKDLQKGKILHDWQGFQWRRSGFVPALP